MEALRASYGDSDSDTEPEADPTNLPPPSNPTQSSPPPPPLPPPPLSLLDRPSPVGGSGFLPNPQANRLRSFPHIEGNFALHVYIPVQIPPASRKDLGAFLKKLSGNLPDLNVVDIDVPVNTLVKDDHKLEQVALQREFHISLGRTVPIRVHQINSMVSMLRQRLQFQRRYWIDFSKWEVFVNDDHTRTFLSLEVLAAGLAEITKQIEAVNEVYRLHNLPEFYKDPRPHISLVWAVGDISNYLKQVVKEEKRYTAPQKRIFTCKFNGILCKIGNKTHEICKLQED